MRCALIRPLYRPSYYDPEVQEPLGIESLAGFLRSHGHEVLLLDAMLSGETEAAIAGRAAAFQPDVVGFSAMSAGDLESIRTIHGKMLETCLDRRWHTVVGGNAVSTEPDLVCDALPAGTFCIRYEGEGPLLALIEALSRGSGYEEVPSLVVRDTDGGVLRTAPGQPIADPDTLPFAARDLAGVAISRSRLVNIQGSRGCVGSCTYCAAPGFPGGGKRWRGRSPRNIAEEMAFLAREHGAYLFNIVDDDFLGPEESSLRRAREFAAALKRRRLRVAFNIQARPSSLTPPAIEALAAAGLTYLFLGFESDDPKVLRRWGRRDDPAVVWELVECLRARGVEVQVGCITFHPDATLSSIKRMAGSLEAHGLLNYRTATNRLQALPGSKIYERAKRDGLVPPGALGTFAPAIKDGRVERLHEHLMYTLLPMRPAWVQAACALPIAAGTHFLSLADGAGGGSLYDVRNILTRLDGCAGSVLFELIDLLEGNGPTTENLEALRRRSLEAGERAARLLSEAGLASYDTIRDAIRMDSGI